nr:C. briggsae CBR-LYS-6.1 protein [Haemonchus contortus]
MLFLLLTVAAISAANIPEPASVESAINGFAYAVDFSVPATASVFNCLRNSNYRTVFLRAFDPRGSGQFDRNSISNIRQAFAARLGVEVYMTPQIRSVKNGTAQFMEVLSNLNIAGIKVNKVWIQVTSPQNWDPYPQNNVFFLNQVMAAAKKYGICLGFYTNFYDWSQITNNAFVNGPQLWYWSVNGGGVRGETPANFNDFRPFARFTKPTVKQFGQVETVCGVTVNRDVYPLNAMKQSTVVQNDENPVVGVTFENTFVEDLLQIN